MSSKPNFKRKFGSVAVRSPVLSKLSVRTPRSSVSRSLTRTRSWRKKATSSLLLRESLRSTSMSSAKSSKRSQM